MFERSKRGQDKFLLWAPTFDTKHWRLRLKFLSSYKTWEIEAKKMHLASSFWQQKLKAKRNFFCSTYRVSKMIFNWTLLKLSSFMLKSSKEAECNFFCLGLSSCSPAPCLGALKAPFSKVPRGVEANFFAQTPTFGIENWRPNKKHFVWPLMELSSMKLKSFRKGRTKMFFAWPPTFGAKSWRSNAICFCLCLSWSSQAWSSKNPGKAKGISYLGQAPKKPKKLQKNEILQKLKVNKHKTKSLKEKELKNMKLEKLGNLKLFCCLCP
jgi:hypothetical protein